MATPHDIPQPKLKFAYRLVLNVDDPVVVSNGPRGSRYLIPILSGTFGGAHDFLDGNFHGEVISPSSDLAVGHADGSGVSLKVNLVMKLHGGATVLGVAEGRSARDPANPNNAKIQLVSPLRLGMSI